mgnify:CR=1 FL=1
MVSSTLQDEDGTSGWCFALLNSKLAEIFFHKNKDGQATIYAHCYVKTEDYTTKKERAWVEKDISRFRVTYRRGKYKIITSQNMESKSRKLGPST